MSDDGNVIDFEIPTTESIAKIVDTSEPPCERVGFPKEQEISDLVNKPAHYNQNGIEVWDIIEHVIGDYPQPVVAYHVASMLKYLCRAPFKGKFQQDIRKAIAHAKRLERYLDGGK